ncbi:serine protease inhibitor Cvsi-2-like isoform X4 [Mizuhopecten yessoensis]|uniref:serine protease inhibitor Cvsi-2-like isoform X4 n=1 Tax=Mizuhopecten yessoensis TaxID=6573 RepID=UPI000B459376|nr:serine protease inhibitor Cvsi-2-like isoform X4 [Mizuhopecten yessoensis]
MKTALILACFVVMMTVYTVSAAGQACSVDSDCNNDDCPTHHGFGQVNVCQNDKCHCHSVHTCTDVGDCSCSTGFTASCAHDHCHCHHDH